MIHVPITLKETFTLDRALEPMAVSIPFESGKVFDVNSLVLIGAEQNIIQCQITPLAYWPNKSLKWVRVFFQYSLKGKQQSKLYLTSLNGADYEKQEACLLASASSIKTQETEEDLLINTGAASFQLNKKELGVFSHDGSSTEKQYTSKAGSLILSDDQDRLYTPKIDSLKYKHQLNGSPCQFQLSLTISGHFEAQHLATSSGTRFETEITFYLNKSYTKWQIALHNPNAMLHTGGTWDLGNKNSQFFKSFNVQLSHTSKNTFSSKLKEDAKWQAHQSSSLLLYQASSGGENWQSQNHVNYQAKVPLTFKGCQFSCDAKSEVADRASPTVHIDYAISNANLTLHIENFWQKFPKSIEIDKDKVILGLFPRQFSDRLELQPGEKKSDTFYIAYAGGKQELQHFEKPTEITVCPHYLAQTNTVPFFANSENERAYNNIIEEGLTANNGFFQKRELIDEYGWRNFGDLYADHETLERECDGELISHYNNQYDPLYGFLRQYLSTENPQWLELANDLADHVKNIDIYHTNEDKCEYNNGLFWHTDHYLPAETASHRTYSRRQIANAYQDHAGGGGPGGQHCYTTGLMLHYFITGDESSKQAVLRLTEWITHVYEGSGTLADLLLAIKNKHRKDIKSVFTGQYPLDRGTGHYIIALLDAYELTGKQSLLDQASLIIKHTVHPRDDIQSRQLTNIEECWFYTVFLQSVYRYLNTKEKLQQFDSSFKYGQDALLHYANWMCDNERPYLDTPEVLEYPNHTWAAQDIRKANVLYMASYYSKDQQTKSKLKEKADELYHYVTTTLASEPTRSFTRILSILMQNHGIKSYVENSNLVAPLPNLNDYLPEKTANNKQLFNAFLDALSNTALSGELNWLRKRSVAVDRFFKKVGI